MLAAIYGSGDGAGEALHPLLAQTDAVVTEESSFRMFQWGRTSGREGRRVQMDGVVGSVTASGELTGLAPFLRVGEWLHVGSGTSMGMGRYRMEAG